MYSKRHILVLLLSTAALEAGFTQGRVIERSASNSVGPARFQLVTHLHELESERDYSLSIHLLDGLLSRERDNYLIHYELAIALIKDRDFSRAKRQLINTIALMPNFASPHNLLGRLVYKKNRTASFMALCFYNLLAPGSIQARRNISYLKELSSRLVSSVNRRGEKTAKHGIAYRSAANDFSSIDLILNAENSMNKAFPVDDPDYFLTRFNWFCESLQENSKDQSGFFWKFYAPYFIDIYKRGDARAAVWIIFDKTPRTAEMADRISRFKAWNALYISKRLYGF